MTISCATGCPAKLVSSSPPICSTSSIASTAPIPNPIIIAHPMNVSMMLDPFLFMETTILQSLFLLLLVYFFV